MLKKLSLAAAFSVLVCLLISVWAVPSIKESRITDSKINTSSSEEESRPSPMYVVMDLRGSIAVYKSGSTEPMQILETPVAVLPEADREMLANGIRVWSDEELQQIIEDYS